MLHADSSSASSSNDHSTRQKYAPLETDNTQRYEPESHGKEVIYSTGEEETENENAIPGKKIENFEVDEEYNELLEEQRILDGNYDDEHAQEHSRLFNADEEGSTDGILGHRRGRSSQLHTVPGESGKSNLKMAFMNMANSIIGAGIIGQPYAIKQAGLIAGLVLLVTLTVAIDWTIRLMVTNAKLSGTDTFQATVKYCFGKWGLIVISLAQGLFAFGGSMAFCVIIGDTIPHVVNALFPGLKSIPILGILAHRNALIILVTLGISLPLALNRSITKLARASGLALISMLIIVFTVVIRGPMIEKQDEAKFTLPLLTINSGIFQSISVISFAFVCHHNSLLIFDSLKIPTMDRFAKVTHWSCFVSMVACIVMGVGGFVVFKDLTKGNVLNSFPQNDVMANIARFCFGLNMLTTLPLEIFVCRQVIFVYIWPDLDAAQVPTKIHALTTVGLVLGAMSVSLFTCNLGAILELVGASSACTMAYILPPMCYIYLSQKSWKQKLHAYLCVIFGCAVMVLSTTQTIYRLVNGSDNQEQCVID